MHKQLTGGLKRGRKISNCGQGVKRGNCPAAKGTALDITYRHKGYTVGNSSKAIKRLSKFMGYVLGRRPDEFGLILDAEGFIKVKTLLQAMHEESGWRHLRMAHLNELIMVSQPAPIEIQGQLVRACDRSHLPQPEQPKQMPKLLYSSIRQRAYPVVHNKGLRPGGLPFVSLSSQKEMALRIGRRQDNSPVILEIQVEASMASGVNYQQYGNLLYLADFIPVGTFTGPPLPKEKPVPAKPQEQLKPSVPTAAGSYFPDGVTHGQSQPATHTKRKRKELEWKKERRRARKEKRGKW